MIYYCVLRLLSSNHVLYILSRLFQGSIAIQVLYTTPTPSERTTTRTLSHLRVAAAESTPAKPEDSRFATCTQQKFGLYPKFTLPAFRAAHERHEYTFPSSQRKSTTHERAHPGERQDMERGGREVGGTRSERMPRFAHCTVYCHAPSPSLITFILKQCQEGEEGQENQENKIPMLYTFDPAQVPLSS
ncbi:hypothetical protein VTK26DRAFT_7193 [Humicola hyalothermophila]